MDYDAEIYNLSQQFYAAYPHAQYPEIVYKQDRPYACLLIEYMDDVFICIPYRTNVTHQNAYHFKNSLRSQQYSSGLDYSKIVLIKDPQYLDTAKKAVVDQDEYKETMQNLARITKEVKKYIEDYKNDMNGVKKLHPKEWQRRYSKSTLPYFNSLM